MGRPKKTRQTSEPEPSEEEVREIKQLHFTANMAQKQFDNLASFLASLGDLASLPQSSLVKTKLAILNEAYEKFQNATTSLASLVEDSDAHFEECCKVDERVTELRVQFENLLETTSGSTTTAPVASLVRSLGVEARLPKIDIPAFDGNADTWMPFFQLFTSLVHNRIELSPLVKFQYLMGALKDRALDIVKDFPLTGENYTEAFELLKRRYDNPRLHVDRLLSNLFALPQLNVESADGIRTIVDKSNSIIKALANLNYPLDKLSNVIVVCTLTRKLDAHTKELYESSAKEHTFDELRIFLENRIPILESLGKRKAAVKQPATAASTSKKTKGKPPIASLATIKSATCPLCTKAHTLEKCETFVALSPNDRYSKTKDLKICVQCLDTRHYVKECKAPLCTTCGKTHHVLLHFPPRRPLLQLHQYQLVEHLLLQI